MSTHTPYNTLLAILLVLTLSFGSPIERGPTSVNLVKSTLVAKRSTDLPTQEFADSEPQEAKDNTPIVEAFYDERVRADPVTIASQPEPTLASSTLSKLTPTSTLPNPALEQSEEVKVIQPLEQSSTTTSQLEGPIGVGELSQSIDELTTAVSTTQEYGTSGTTYQTEKTGGTESPAISRALSSARNNPSSSQFQSTPRQSESISETASLKHENESITSHVLALSVTRTSFPSLTTNANLNINSKKVDAGKQMTNMAPPLVATIHSKNVTSSGNWVQSNNSFSMKSTNTTTTLKESSSTLQAQATKIYSAIPYPKSDPMETKNAVPMSEVDIAFEYSGDGEGSDSTRTAEVHARWNKDAVALDNMGGLESVKCSRDFIDIHFRDIHMAETARSRWSADPFYLLSNRDGCQKIEEPYTNLVEKPIWSADGLSVQFKKQEIPFEDALEEYKGSFGSRLDQPESFRPNMDEMLARKNLPNLQKLPNPNLWNDEQRTSVEDLLYLNKMAGQLVMQNLRSNASASNLNSGGSLPPHNFEKRGFWDWLKKATVSLAQAIQKGIPEAVKAIWNGIVEFAENLAELMNTRSIDKTYIFNEVLTDHVELAAASPWEKSVELLNFEPSGAELVIYCVDCNFEFVFDLKGKFDLDIHANRYGVSVDFEGDLDTTIVFGIHAKTTKYDLERSISVISFPLGPIAFPGFNLGPQIGLNLGVSLGIDAEGEIKIGAQVEVLDMVLHASAGSLLKEQQTPDSWETNIQNKCSASARIELSGSLFAEVVLEFSAELLKWKIATGAKARFSLDASAKAQLDYNSQDGLNEQNQESSSRLSNGIWAGKGGKPKKGSSPPQKGKGGSTATKQEDEDSKISDSVSASDGKVSADPDCTNGVVFQLSLNWKLEMFAGDCNYEIDLSGIVPTSLPIVEPTCLFQFAKRDGEIEDSNPNISGEETVHLTLSADMKNHVYASDIGTLYLTNSSDAQGTTPFSIKSEEKPEGIAAAAARDSKGRSFVVFDFISTTGVSNLQMFSDRDIPDGAVSTRLIQSEDAVFIMNEAKEELYNLVVCATALGAQLFAYSEKAFPPTELTERINEKFSFNFASIEACSIPQLSLKAMTAQSP